MSGRKSVTLLFIVVVDGGVTAKFCVRHQHNVVENSNGIHGVTDHIVDDENNANERQR